MSRQPAAPPSGAPRIRHELELTVPDPAPARLTDWLAGLAGLPRQRIKDAIEKGAVWYAPRGRRLTRLRRVTQGLAPGDGVALYYDSQVLACEPPEPLLLASERHYTVWEKPPGLLVEGSRYGDHATLERIAALRVGRPAWLPHRLDREAGGVMLVAHTGSAAARLSALFRERRIGKGYQAEVSGRPCARPGMSRTIDAPLDGKPSLTTVTEIARDEGRDTTLLAVDIETGRYHQIRRHLAGIGHPILGDPLYDGRPDARGLRLRAVRLTFTDPWDGQERNFGIKGLGPAPEREEIMGAG